MATRKPRGFWVADSILGQDWDDATLATLVRLLAHLRLLGLDPDEGGHLVLSVDEACAVAGTHARERAWRTLLGLPRVSGLAFEVAALPGHTAMIVRWPMPLRLAGPEPTPLKRAKPDQSRPAPARRGGAR